MTPFAAIAAKPSRLREELLQVASQGEGCRLQSDSRVQNAPPGEAPAQGDPQRGRDEGDTRRPRRVHARRPPRRALLETLYSTGLRRNEVAVLGIRDVDAARGLVSVRQGKGRKDRMVAISENAARWVAKYLEESRPDLATAETPRRFCSSTTRAGLGVSSICLPWSSEWP